MFLLNANDLYWKLFKSQLYSFYLKKKKNERNQNSSTSLKKNVNELECDCSLCDCDHIHSNRGNKKHDAKVVIQ